MNILLSRLERVFGHTTLRAIVPLVLLGLGAGVGATAQTNGYTNPASRDKYQWPFAQNSPWNLPIGSGAVYKSANIGRAGFVGADEELMFKVPAGSPERNIYGTEDWNNRCASTKHWQGTMFIPDNQLQADAQPGNTPNNCATFLQPDGETVKQLAPFTRCKVGGNVYGWKTTDQNIKTSDGLEGAHWGSKLSGFGGSVRKGELTGPDPIRHALKINLWGQKYYYYGTGPNGGGFRWPATQADSYAGQAWGYRRQEPQLSTPNPDLVLGALLAIRPGVTPEQLGISSAVGRKLFRALQDYGAYLVDDAAWDAHYLCVEKGVQEELENTGVYPHASGGEYFEEFNKLCQALHVVTNNSPTTVGGGGTARRAPLAPPFIGEGTTPLAGIVKVLCIGDSRTAGAGASNYQSVSYRGYLRKKLLDNGYTNVDFVGPENLEAVGDAQPADGAHGAYSGFGIGPNQNASWSIRQFIDNILNREVNVILLDIGINDFFGDGANVGTDPTTADDRYEALVQRIRELKPNAKILCATMSPVKFSPDWSNQGNAYDLNQRIKSLPAKYANVFAVDLYAQMRAALDFTNDYGDEVHFNQNGGLKLGNFWYAALLPHLGGTTPPPPTPVSVPNGVYRLAVRHSGQALDVDGGTTANGTRAMQWPKNGAASQNWTLTAAGDGYYTLTNQKSGTCLDVSNSSTANGAKVQIWACNASAAQLWSFVARPDGFYQLVNKASGKVLDVAGVSTTDGATVHQWTAGNGANQQWKLEPVGALANGSYHLVARHSGKALGHASASWADGVAVHQWDKLGATDQNWTLTADGTGYYKITNQRSGKCLDVNGSSTANGAKVQDWSDNGSAAQRWKIEATSDGHYKLTNKASGKCLDVTNASTANGALAQQWEYAGGTNQQFKLEPATPSAARPAGHAAAPTQARTGAATDLTVSPNPLPARERPTLHIQAFKDQHTSVLVQNKMGLVSLFGLSLKAGPNDFRMPTDLAPGETYYVHALVDGQKLTFTLKAE